jgi:hypothetical protein
VLDLQATLGVLSQISESLYNLLNVAGHIPARISDVPSWDVDTILI